MRIEIHGLQTLCLIATLRAIGICWLEYSAEAFSGENDSVVCSSLASDAATAEDIRRHTKKILILFETPNGSMCYAASSGHTADFKELFLQPSEIPDVEFGNYLKPVITQAVSKNTLDRTEQESPFDAIIIISLSKAHSSDKLMDSIVQWCNDKKKNVFVKLPSGRTLPRDNYLWKVKVDSAQR